MRKKTRKAFEEYLNDVVPVGSSQYENQLPPDARYGTPYGTAMRKHDPIQFQVGYEEWTAGDFA